MDCACREALRKAQALLLSLEEKLLSPNTSAYCQARERLKSSWLADIHEGILDALESRPRTAHLWRGRNVKIVDGSSVSMPDTEANQAAYPQQEGQKKGCGFPVMRLAVIFSLATGAILDMAWDALTIGEGDLFRRMWSRLVQGDVVLADRGFCGYADFWCLMRRGVDCVMRQRSNRTTGIRHVRQLGKGDRIVKWVKTKVCPLWMDDKEWAAMPATMILREIRYRVKVLGFRSDSIVVVTNLLDEAAYPAKAFVELYRRRWRAELFLRDIKITLGMDVLRCKTPAMIEKELRMHVIGYNLIRALMFETAVAHDVPLDRLSVKGTLSTVKQWAPVLAAIHDDDALAAAERALRFYIAYDLVPLRPNRAEPRAKKRRPKGYPLLNKPRRDYLDSPHRSRYKAP